MKQNGGGERVFHGHGELNLTKKVGVIPGISAEIFDSILIPITKVWDETGSQVPYDEEKINNSTDQLLAVMGGLKQVINTDEAQELAPKIVEDVIAARKDAEANGAIREKDYLANLMTHYLIQLANPEIRATLDQKVLFELIEAKGKKSSLNKKDQKTLNLALARKGGLTYKKDWLGGIEGAVKALGTDLGELGAGIWQGKDGENYLEEIENVLNVLEAKLPKSTSQELAIIKEDIVAKTFYQYVDDFRVSIGKSRGEGKNGDELIKRVEAFTKNALVARDLLDGELGDNPEQEKLEKTIKKTSAGLSQHRQGLYSAMILVGWKEGTRDSAALVPEAVASIRESYLYELVRVVDRKVFDELGAIILKAENTGDFRELLAAARASGELNSITKWPDAILLRVADCFVEAGFLTKAKGGKYKVKERHGSLPPHLGFDSLREVMMAADFLADVSREKMSMDGGFPTMMEQYKKNKAKLKVPEVLVNATDGKVLYLTDLRVGHKNLDIEFLDKAITELESWGEEDRPKAVVLSDMVQGNFLSLQTGRKPSLVEGYGDMSAQFQRAKQIIDRFQALDIHVVVIQGDEAVRIAKDYTLKVLKEMGEMAKALDADTSFSSFSEIYKIQQTPAWATHNQFQFDVVWPYCLRSGRGLLNAEEMADRTNLDEEKVHISEYFMLFDVYTAMLKGEEPNSEYAKLLNMENIPLPGKEFPKFDIVDDAVMTVHTPSVDYTHRIFNRFTFSAEPRYQDFTSALMALIGQQAANGKQPADLTLVANQGLAAWVAAEDGTKWGAFGATLHRSDAEERGRILRLPGDPSWRSLTTRKVGFMPATVGYELTENKMLRVQIMTPKLLEKSMASSERRAIVLLQDWQQGSPSAKPDYQVRQLDYVMSKIAPEMKVNMFANGDWGQMRNYFEFANESVSQGLIRIDQQADYNKAILHNTFDHRSAAELDQIESFDVTVGNHEWNSQHKFTGATHSRYIDETMKGIMQAHDPKGTMGLAERVLFHQAMLTRQGDYLVGMWSAPKQVEEFGILIQHLILDKMAKGPGGPSIFQMIPFVTGIGGLFDKTDIFGFGHWHYGQGAVIGEKLGVVGPAWAGLSPYEFKLGYRPKPGFATIYYGGGMPVEVEYGSMATLAYHEIKDGPYSKQSLADHGYHDDPDYNPLRDPYSARSAVPQSALGKFLWNQVDKLNYQPEGNL